MKLKGFSLIELCIAIALFLLILTLTLPSIWFLKRQELVSQVDKIYSVFCYLQKSAIASNKDLVLEFDHKANSYSFENSSIQLSKHIKFAFKNGVKGPPSSPIKLLDKPITFINNKVVFYADGKMQPGTVYLTDSKQHYLYGITIPISQVSLIRKYKYIDKWILLN